MSSILTGNQPNLPLSCKINSVRLPCSYTLAPFTVTISEVTNKLNLGSDNIVNITTDYLDLNGIYYPANQGRYFNSSSSHQQHLKLLERAAVF